MKHLVVIQSEFIKEAREWDDLTLDEQKGYLKRHPKSRRKLTAKPEHQKTDVKEKLEEKQKTVTESKTKTEPKTDSKTPKLDAKLNDFYDVCASVLKKKKRSDEDWDKLDTEWTKLFPKDAKASGYSVFSDAERIIAMRNGEEWGHRNNIKLRPKDEFVQAMKDAFIDIEGRLPIVEGEEDPTTKIKSEYGFTKGITDSEYDQLKKIESELPEDQKKFAKYLVPVGRYKEKRTLEDVSGERPIIKQVDDQNKIEYLVPTSNQHSSRNSDKVIGDSHLSQFDTIEQAKEFIKKAPELERKADLRDQIEQVHDDIRDKFKSAIHDESRAFTRTLDVIAQSNKQLSEDQKLKFKNFSDVVGYPEGRTTEEIKSAVDSFDQVEDAINSAEFPPENKWDNDELATAKENLGACKKALDDIYKRALIKDKLVEMHGYETKDDIKLPEGFKFKDKSNYESYSDAIIIGSDVGDIEIQIALIKPSKSWADKYSGEVFYTVPGKDGHYSLGRRGIDFGIAGNWSEDIDINEKIKELIDTVRAKQNKISKSVNVPVAGGVWNVVPERLEEMKRELKAGKSVTFAPHGMGTGYHVSAKPARYSQKASKDTEEVFGISPLYIESYDHD